MKSGIQTLQGAERVSGLCSPVSPLRSVSTSLHDSRRESTIFCSGGTISYDKWGLPWVN